jgi:Fe2+ transport system protein FeoA
MNHDKLASSTSSDLESADKPSHAALISANHARPLPKIPAGMRVKIVPESVPLTHLPLFEAMGLCHDCPVHVCQSKGTCILDVNGSRIGLSKQIASTIQAVPVSG